MKTKGGKVRKVRAWAIVQVKDGIEYKKGELVDISLWERNLRMLYNRGYQKIKRITVNA